MVHTPHKERRKKTPKEITGYSDVARAKPVAEFNVILTTQKTDFKDARHYINTSKSNKFSNNTGAQLVQHILYNLKIRDYRT